MSTTTEKHKHTNMDINSILSNTRLGAILDDVAPSRAVHLRLQQRTGRKSITLVSGLNKDLDLKKICRECKKSFSCNGAVIQDDEVGPVLQLSGDQRVLVRKFLIENGLCDRENVILRG